MAGARDFNGHIGSQMWDLLERNPSLYDVVFVVGGEAVEVKARKFVLMAASPVFEFFLGQNDNVEKHFLVDVDPVAFQLLIKLVINDTWSVEFLNALHLPLNTSLGLLGLCRRFEITKGIKNLMEALDGFIRFFGRHKDTSKLLKMSQSNLATFVSFKDLEMTDMDIFEGVCRWAELQCTEKGIETSGENLRKILGEILFEIRFPAMSTEQFSKVCRLQSNLLTDQERVAIYNFIGMDDQEKQKYYESLLPFKSHARKSRFDGSTLCLTKNVKIVDSPHFVCDGTENENTFKISNGEITLHGIGFFGPNDQDSYFDVTVQIRRSNNGSDAYNSGTIVKRIFARKRETFHFMFDEPIKIEQKDSPFRDLYYIYFWLKGPNTMAAKRKKGDHLELEQTGVKFDFVWSSGINQVAELKYKNSSSSWLKTFWK